MMEMERSVDKQLAKTIEDENSDKEDMHEIISKVNQDAVQSVMERFNKTSEPTIKHASVTNSENVQFGNNTYFNGTVVIKQIIQNSNGVDNASYVKTEDEIVRNKTAETKDFISSFETYTKYWKTIVPLLVGFILIIAAVWYIVISTIRPKNSDYNQSVIDNSSDPSIDILPLVNNSCGGYYWIYFFIAVGISILTHFILSLQLTMYWINSIFGKQVINTTNNEASFGMIDRDEDKPFIAPNHLRIIERNEWLAQPPTGKLDPLKQPIPWVIIAHTATESCHNQSECVLRTRVIQNFHVESRGWYDIGYNFLVGGDGSVYIGRGWDYIGAHTKGYNTISVGIGFIGTFTIDPPPQRQLDACQRLIKLGVTSGKLAKDYKLLAHRQLMSTSSPGDALFNIIKHWPNFVEEYSEIENMFKQ